MSDDHFPLLPPDTTAAVGPRPAPSVERKSGIFAQQVATYGTLACFALIPVYMAWKYWGESVPVRQVDLITYPSQEAAARAAALPAEEPSVGEPDGRDPVGKEPAAVSVSAGGLLFYSIRLYYTREVDQLHPVRGERYSRWECGETVHRRTVDPVVFVGREGETEYVTTEVPPTVPLGRCVFHMTLLVKTSFLRDDVLDFPVIPVEVVPGATP